jgi:hypothetical protein
LGGADGEGSVRPGQVLVEQVALRSMTLDAENAAIRIETERERLEFGAIRATTLLGPWDGARGVIERAEVVAAAAGEICVSIRVRFETVPRTYRLVCGSIQRMPAANPRR